jgi:hypothetical protein
LKGDNRGVDAVDKETSFRAQLARRTRNLPHDGRTQTQSPHYGEMTLEEAIN